MTDHYPFNNIDTLLLQFSLHTRELLQKKNEIIQQIKVCSADIAERRSHIETGRRNTKKLEEEIRVKQSTLIHNKDNAKSMKETNNLLLQYQQTLKEELESRKASYTYDLEVYKERIASYREIFQSHKEYYCQNPLAQKLLMLQAEKEEIESRMKACDDQITMKQKELHHLTGPAVSSSSIEKLPDSVSAKQPITEPEKQFDDSDSSVDISSLHLNQTKALRSDHKATIDVNTGEIICEENRVQASTACSPFPDEANSGLWLSQQVDEQRWQDVEHTEEQGQETGPEDQVLQSTISNMEEAMEQEEMEEVAAIEEEQATSKEDNNGCTAFPQSSPASVKAGPSTSVFPFNFSPGSSPHQGTSDTKSPAFPFSLNSDPSTPGFSGFGFDLGSSQDEDSSFAFPGLFSNEKKTTESKSSGCSEFPFGQPEQSEDFQFAFNFKSPQTTNQDNTGDDFPFSFNF